MKNLLIPLTAVLVAVTAAPANVAKTIADNLVLRVGVKTNHPNAEGPKVDCSGLGADWASCGIGYLDFDYKGTTIDAKDWSLYLHSIRRILKLETEDFTVEHVTGDLHKIMPSSTFKGLKAGKMRVPYIFEYWMVFESDFMPRYWVAGGDDSESFYVVPNTDTADKTSMYANAITGTNWKTTLTAPLPQANVSTRITLNGDTKMMEEDELLTAIIPTPLETTRLEGWADLTDGVAFNPHDFPPPMIGSSELRLSKFGIKANAKGYPVDVKIDSAAVPKAAAKAHGYTLKVTPEGAFVTGYDVPGAFYGIQSFVSLVKVGSTKIPAVNVVDAPRFDYRGMHVDVGRNFHSKEALMRIMDHMGAYKIAMLHLHLSDDEGWRIEIPGLPELTEVGSQRCFDVSESECLLPQLGSGPTNKNFGSGYLTRMEYIELLQYATARCIEVFPEFDMPGHSRAAVMSMEARYHRLMKEDKKEEAEMYRLMDPDDESKFLSVQYYDKRSQINVCVPGAMNFIKKLVKEVISMHTEADVPLKRWHFGADEAHNILLGGGYVDKTKPDAEKVGKGQVDTTGLSQPFEKSPICQKFMKEKGLEVKDLIGYLAIEVSKILKEHKIENFMAWQDGMKNLNATQLATESNVLNFWDTLFWGGADSVWAWDTKGYQVVLSIPDYLYFDFPEENNPKERGYYWASRHQSMRHVFGLAPENLPQNAETSLDRNGEVFEIKSAKLPEGKKVKDVIVGMQGQLWSETMRTDDQVEHSVFPRLFALAERAWHKGSWELSYKEGRVFKYGVSDYVDKEKMLDDWTHFANAMGQRELPKMDAAGIKYRVPVPGAMIKDGKLVANVELPGVPIWCSLDGKKYSPYEEPGVSLPEGTTKVYVRAGYKDHYSRAEVVEA